LGVSTKLLHIGPELAYHLSIFTESPRLTQPRILRGTGNENQPKGDDALRLCYGSFGHCTCG